MNELILGFLIGVATTIVGVILGIIAAAYAPKVSKEKK